MPRDKDMRTINYSSCPGQIVNFFINVLSRLKEPRSNIFLKEEAVFRCSGIPSSGELGQGRSCTSHSLDWEAPINVMQNALAHANLATIGRYTHVRSEGFGGDVVGDLTS